MVKSCSAVNCQNRHGSHAGEKCFISFHKYEYMYICNIFAIAMLIVVMPCAVF